MDQPISLQPEFFEDLFLEHYTALCAVAYKMLGSEDAAKDIVQDLFLYCWDKRDVITITQSFRGYAIRAVRNACINRIKKNDKVNFEELESLDELADETNPIDPNLLESRDIAVWAAVDRLPPQQKRIFLLSNQDGYKYKDIAEQLNISVNTVKTQMKLAFQFLRKECNWIIKMMLFMFFLKK